MRFSIFAATALAGTAFAADHSVKVGTKTGNLTFNPDTLTAAEGDTITFSYWPKAHSVVQATFDKPCQPMDNGIWSGFVMTNDTNAVSPTTFQVTVKNASVPMWIYCSQAKHCQAGMVMVVNQAKTGNKTLEAFKAMAKEATKNESPSSTSAVGGMLMTNGSMTSGSMSPSSTGAASNLAVSGMAFSGVVGMIAYALF